MAAKKPTKKKAAPKKATGKKPAPKKVATRKPAAKKAAAKRSRVVSDSFVTVMGTLPREPGEPIEIPPPIPLGAIVHRFDPSTQITRLSVAVGTCSSIARAGADGLSFRVVLTPAAETHLALSANGTSTDSAIEFVLLEFDANGNFLTQTEYHVFNRR